ncbi:hypothetical protein [Pleionea mediterranea]|uniref:Uncharacterized protein n=1 Tax=Pleionea mediterranea TaxID=523701 RepID=A0A316FVM2_9GAMM|nr:hypothetical protein [Pleionea mediterranea]PWK52834.1 hypothetical protein C8D97_10452 [Pleionea mediterranea]
MNNYIINKKSQPTGEHEVHNEDICNHLPNLKNRLALGQFFDCQQAVDYAEKQYPGRSIDGCIHCSPACHTR